MADQESGRAWGTGATGIVLAAVAFWLGGARRGELGPTSAAPTTVVATAPRTTDGQPAGSGLPSAGAAAQRAASAAGQGVSAPRGSRYTAGERLLEEFFGRPLPSAAGEDTALAGWRLRPRGAPAPVRGERPPVDFDAIVATLPDPFDSHLDYSYDSHLEAIQLAFSDAGYVLDRFWLPQREDSLRVDAEGGAIRVPTHELHPGAILFRRVGWDAVGRRPGATGGRRRADTLALRLVYVVPEMPTGGVHKEAFTAALVDRDALRRRLRADTAGGDVVRVVGPNFSGAALSVAGVLRDWLADPARRTARASLVSGTATSLSFGLAESSVGDRIEFATTINPDHLFDAVLRCGVLPRLGLEPRQVVLLVESSTEYGGSVERSAGGPCDARYSRAPFHVVRFPLAIASLRSEYSRHPDAPAGPPVPGTQAPPRIPVPLGDPSHPRERPVARSPLTPAGLDLELASIVRLLRDGQVRAVGLLGSDVRDKLFLADELRKRVHDVQLFTFESELLYARPDFSEALRGMLVFSTYPLLPAAQLWGREPEGWMVARSDGVLGVYNATLVAIHGEARAGRRLREYGSPVRLSPTARPDSATSVPPVWLTVVGRGTLAPVTVFPDSRAWPQTLRVRVAREAPRPPVLPIDIVAWIVMLAAAGATVLLASSPIWRVATGTAVRWRSDPRGDDPSAPYASPFVLVPTPPAGTDTARAWRAAEEFEKVRAASLHVHRWLYRALLIVALLAVLAPPVTLVRRAHAIGHASPDAIADRVAHAVGALLAVAVGVGILGVVVSLATALFILGLTAWRGLGFLGRRRYPWAPTNPADWLLEILLRGTVVTIGLWYGWLVLQFALSIRRLADSRPDVFTLLFYRALHVDTGVSPLLPVVLGALGFVAWCAWHRQRILLLQRRPPFEAACLRLAALAGKPPSGGAAWPAAAARAAAAVTDVRTRLFMLVPDRRGTAFATVLIAAGLWYWTTFARTPESVVFAGDADGPNAFEVLLRFSVVGLLAATAWSVYRLIVVWGRLRDCLEELSELPIVTAFERLPPRVSRLTRLSFFSPRWRPVIEAVTAQQWAHLRALHDERSEQFVEQLAGAPGCLARLDSLMALPDPVTDRGWEREVQRVERLALVLDGFWHVEPADRDIEAVAQELATQDAKRLAEGEPALVSTSSRLRRRFTGAAGLWLREAEELAAVRVVEYVEWVLRHLRRLAGFLLLALLLATAMLSSYPFHPQSRAKLALVVVLVAAVCTLLTVMSQMNRDEVLSRITKTDPGRITWSGGFVVNVLLFAVVPLIALVSSEFPEARALLFGWVEPLLRAVARS